MRAQGRDAVMRDIPPYPHIRALPDPAFIEPDEVTGTWLHKVHPGGVLCSASGTVSKNAVSSKTHRQMGITRIS